MLFKRQKTDGLLLTLIALGVFLYASYRPHLRLHVEMPEEFVDVPEGMLNSRAAEEKVAKGYWQCLVDDVQWKYGYGHGLPPEPPIEFNLGMHGKDTVPEDGATRIRYWRRVRHLWYVRSSWEEEYEWNFDWTTHWLQTGAEWLHQRFSI